MFGWRQPGDGDRLAPEALGDDRVGRRGWSCNHLTATLRSSSVSVATHTSAMPPCPMRRSSRYRPASSAPLGACDGGALDGMVGRHASGAAGVDRVNRRRRRRSVVGRPSSSTTTRSTSTTNGDARIVATTAPAICTARSRPGHACGPAPEFETGATQLQSDRVTGVDRQGTEAAGRGRDPNSARHGSRPRRPGRVGVEHDGDQRGGCVE